MPESWNIANITKIMEYRKNYELIYLNIVQTQCPLNMHVSGIGYVWIIGYFIIITFIIIYQIDIIYKNPFNNHIQSQIQYTFILFVPEMLLLFDRYELELW